MAGRPVQHASPLLRSRCSGRCAGTAPTQARAWHQLCRRTRVSITDALACRPPAACFFARSSWEWACLFCGGQRGWGEGKAVSDEGREELLPKTHMVRGAGCQKQLTSATRSLDMVGTGWLVLPRLRSTVRQRSAERQRLRPMPAALSHPTVALAPAALATSSCHPCSMGMRARGQPPCE